MAMVIIYDLSVRRGRYTASGVLWMPLDTDQTLSCPECGYAIKLTESLAAPLVAATRAEYERRLAAQTETVNTEKRALAAQQQANERRAAELAAATEDQQNQVAQAVRHQVREQVQQQLTRDRKVIAEEESARARQQVDDELKTHQTNLEQQTRRIETLTQKLATAQEAEASLLSKEQELEDKKREFALDLQKGIAAGLEQARAQALREAQATLDLKVQDRENTIAQLRDQITSLQRRAEQSSQQAQGESLELALEQQLRTQFPFDLIEPVAKGEFGGDVLQHVRDNTGQLCGKILWESKRTRAWSDGWLSKLKHDQRSASADIAVIVSQTMPKDVVHFEQLDGIWVSSLTCIPSVASALRISLIELAILRRSNEGQTTKSQQIYTYLTGPRFKHRVECIAEKFTELRKDLDAERKWMNKQWAKRDRELTTVLEATSGMYGDLQGIAGRSLQEIDVLEGPLLLELDQ
jgi:hypothetical protein